MIIKTIKTIAEHHNVRVSESKKDGKRVIGLHGFKSDVESALRWIKGYHVEWTDTGAYLYSAKANWS